MSNGLTGRDITVRRALLRLNARAWGIACGLLFGGGLFLATNWLVVKSGPNPGQHLRLLAAFFPGYSVTFIGSLIGFVYAFVIGYALGRLIGEVYNRLTPEP
jgi:ABC-type nitrate/sulfonate/bicarbonate transport system permease component